MTDTELGLDLGVLCRCCDFTTYKLPDKVDGLTPDQLRLIEELCKMCVDNLKKNVVNG